MNFISATSPPMSVLLYLANVAMASVLVCGVGLMFERVCRGASLPFRHMLLVAALASTLAAPIIIGVTLASGRSPFHFRIASLDKSTFPTKLPELSPAGQSSAQIELRRAQSVSLAKSADFPEMAGSKTASREAPSVAPILRDRNVTGRSFRLDMLPLLGMSLAMVWIAGCAVSIWRLVLGLLQLHRLTIGLRPVADARLRELAAATSSQLGLRRAPKLFESQSVPSPLSVGLIHPIIILPLGIASSFDTNQLEGLFLHEMAHVVRRDHQVGVLQRLATMIFWWNGLARRASARVSAIREQICDDVSTSSRRADEYAAMLVELAERVAYSRALPATLGASDPTASEFSQRIRRLLDPERRMVTKLDGQSKAVAAICSLVMLLPGTAPLIVNTTTSDEFLRPAGQSNEPLNVAKVEPAIDADKKSNASGSPEAAPINWPKVLRGVIKDADEKPIAGARVRLDFEKIHEYTIGRWDELLDSQSQVTGMSGEYHFDATKLPRLTHRPFVLTISCKAKGYADAKWWSWYSRNDVNVDEHLTDVKMLPGRVVRGRCVDPNGVPVSGAIVKMASDYDSKSPSGNWAWDPRQTHDDGKFEFSIPRDSKSAFAVWAIHPQWAPQLATLPGGGDDLSDIRFQRGAPIKGTVRNADGTPCSGTVVVAESEEYGQLQSVAFAVDVATKTDALGNYTLQPLLGSFKVFLSRGVKTDNNLERRFVVADEPPPLVVPARVNVSEGEPQTKDFVAGPTLKVQGTVRWADGRPVERCEVKASYLGPDSRTGIWIARTLTNDQGKYTIELPKPIKYVSIHVVGEFDEHHVWCPAFPADNVAAKQKSQQTLMLIPLEGDLDGIDWALRPIKR